MSLQDGQFQLGNTVFGVGTVYPCEPPEFGPPDLTVNDTPRPGMDGLRIGRETRQGRTLTFDLGVQGYGNGKPGGQLMFERLAALEKEWMFEPIRDFPQICQPLSYRRAGETRRVYGRPRRFSPVFPDTMAPWIDVTADYQTLDHYSYSETIYYTNVGTVAASKAGLRAPVRTPISLVSTPTQTNPNPIKVGGTSPAWLRFFIFGPITNPVVEVAGAFRVELNVALRYDEWAIIDPTPWGQMVRKSDASNLAGYLSWNTPPMSRMKVPPGSWRIRLSGRDPSGTAFVYIDWRNCYHSF